MNIQHHASPSRSSAATCVPRRYCCAQASAHSEESRYASRIIYSPQNPPFIDKIERLIDGKIVVLR